MGTGRLDTITTLIDNSCRQFADCTAFHQKRGGQWQETSYRALQEMSDRIAAGLTKSGFQPGDHAALLGSSSPDWVMAYLGILKACGVVVPIDKELKGIEVHHILSHSEARAIFIDGDRLDMVLDMLGGVTELRLIVTLSVVGCLPDIHGISRCMLLPLNGLLHEGPFSPVARRPDDSALILLYLGNHRALQGRHAHPRQHSLQ